MPKTGDDPFYLKVSRAQQHRDLLDAEIREFIKGNPYGMSIDFYADAELTQPLAESRKSAGDLFWVTVGVTVERETPPEWGPVIGDCLHNLRSALDHLAWRLAGPNAKPRATEFPIFIDRNRYRRDAPRKLDGIPARARTRLERLQPYHRGKDAAAHPLWVLHELSNIDKHRFPHIGGAAIRQPEIRLRRIYNTRPESVEVVHDGPFEHGTTIAKLAFRITEEYGNKMEVEMGVKDVFDVAFDEAGPAVGGSVVQTLDQLIVFVRSEVLPKFKRFL